MNETQIKRRAWIKNIIIIFLAALLLLTLFSNTILNRSLPEVAVQYPQYDTIASRIRANGTVTANQSYSVTIDQTRVIASVEVRSGQSVQKGDVLFRLEEGDSGELDQAQRELQDLNIQLINQMKQDPTASGNSAYTAAAELESSKETLKNQKEELAVLEKELSAAIAQQNKLPTSIAVRDAENLVKQLDSAIQALTDEIARLTGKRSLVAQNNGYLTPDEIAAKIAEAEYNLGEANYYLAQAGMKYDTAHRKVKSLEEQIKIAEDNLAAATDAYDSQLKESGGNVTWESLNASMQSVNSKKQQWEQAKQYFRQHEYDEALAEYNRARNAYNAEYATASNERRAELRTELNNAETVYKPLEAEYQNIRSLETAYNQALMQYQKDYYAYMQSSQQNSVLANLQAAQKQASDNVNALKKQKEAADKEFKDAETEYNNCKTKVTEAESALKTAKSYHEYNTLTDQIRTLEQQKEQLTRERADAQAIVDSSSDSNKSAAAEKVRDKQKLVNAQKSAIAATEQKIQKLEAQVEADKQNSNLDYKRYQIELQKIKDQIAAKEAQIARLEENKTDGTVVSPVSGVIESLNVAAGQEAKANTPIASVILSDMGYTMTCTVTNEQAAKVSVGDMAEIQWYYYGEMPTARVISIKSDTSSQGKNKIITLEVIGQITPNTNLSFTLGEKNTSYDTVVPNSAVREDTNGTFVLIVTAKSTPLGNRYTAQRVEVEVLASDETNSAVSGKISGQYVITASETPIESGKPVRLKEN